MEDQNELTYMGVTEGGQSGCPVYLLENNQAYVYAVHAGGWNEINQAKAMVLGLPDREIRNYAMLVPKNLCQGNHFVSKT